MIATRHGDISVMGRDGNADITSQDGDVSVTDLNGTLTLNLDGSSVRASQISSDVTVQGRGKDISLEDVKGAVRLDGDFMESVKLTRIAKTVSFKSTRTDMDFTKLDGYLNLDSGDLEASSLTGPLRLRTRSKDIMLNGITSDVHLNNENGAVEIHLNKLGSVEVTNAQGDIRIFVPEKAAFQVDAQARDGEIESDFPQLKVDNGDNRSTATGSVNGGGPHMVLNLEHGSIEIRKGVATPVPPTPPKAGKVVGAATAAGGDRELGPGFRSYQKKCGCPIPSSSLRAGFSRSLRKVGHSAACTFPLDRSPSLRVETRSDMQSKSNFLLMRALIVLALATAYLDAQTARPQES